MTPRPTLVFFAVTGFVMATQVALGRAPLGDATWTSETTLFWFVVVAASLCLAASLGVVWMAHRRDLAEVGLIGAFFFAVSWLPLVHGLTVPGVLYGPNSATTAAAAAAVPLAVGVAMPLILPGRPVSRAVLRRWRPWVTAWLAAVTALGTALLVETELLGSPTMGTAPTVVPGMVAALGCLALANRQLRLAEISRRPGAIVVAAAFGLVGTSALAGTGDRPFSGGFWLAHALAIAGVLLGCVAAVIVYRLDRSLRRLVDPVAAVEPVAALELGLDPVVHRFVALLAAKDVATRHHVVRCADLVMRIGPGLGVPPDELRDLGVAAVLHDLGKLETPDHILTKPHRLTDDERAIMQRHAAAGAELAQASPALRGAAPAIRGHHERWDGRGYPDGLAGPAIPAHARIVSVCDAFDAMTFSRHYRAGMGTDRALAILREHAGSQWDPEVVAALCAHVERHGPPADGGSLATAGTGPEDPVDDFCGCADALPAAVGA